jgi:isopentenyl-diphosphate delta-isomerase
MDEANLAQDQNELFDILPEPTEVGSLDDPEIVAKVSVANRSGFFPTATRKEVHKQGLWHRSIGLWLFTGDGRVIVQKRSMLKDTNPGKWQMSVAGHVSSGQSVIEAVLAEASEELGLNLRPEDLMFVGCLSKSESGKTERFGPYIDREYKFLYISRITSDVPLSLNRSEVERIELRNLDEVFQKLRARDPDYCPVDIRALDKAYQLIKSNICT